MPRPLIGVTAYLEAARWGTWVREAVLSPPAYARAVEKSGGAAVILPPLGTAAIDDYLRGLDGIILLEVCCPALLTHVHWSQMWLRLGSAYLESPWVPASR